MIIYQTNKYELREKDMNFYLQSRIWKGWLLFNNLPRRSQH